MRTWLVFSKARRSMALASLKDAKVERSEVVGGSAGITVRDLEYATAVTNRATGRDSTLCAEAV